jgi:hypothetical protein
MTKPASRDAGFFISASLSLASPRRENAQAKKGAPTKRPEQP